MNVATMSAEELADYYAGQQTDPIVPEPKLESEADPVVSIQPDPDSDPIVSEPIVESSFFDYLESKVFPEGKLSYFINEDESPIYPKTNEEFIDLLDANRKQWEEAAREEITTKTQQDILSTMLENTTPAYKFILENSINFRTPEELLPLIQSVNTQDALEGLDMDNEQDQEYVVRAVLKLQGFDDQTISDDISDLKDRERLLDRSQKLFPVLKKYQSDITESIALQAQKKQQDDNIFWDSYLGKLGNVFNAQEVAGMQLTREHKELVARNLVPNQQIGGLPIYSLIDKLVGEGDFEKLAKIALIGESEELFDNYYGSKNLTKLSQSLQKTLRTSVKSSSSSTDSSVKPTKKKEEDMGYGYFMK